ncbi:MAG TPA: TetR/AcrR family transcriptional regulator [Aeromicrobium sp.]|nr:TetR/AcrR family transcriptional regulator [Aeromicrobium sp.]HKY57016.1 TetR/AcrR family transcriptional regulator [Aeromicrobium sp.]
MSVTERSYRGKSGGERAAERRARLIDATIAVLSASGEAHATMTAVCAAAGLTERYFYESFSGLDDAKLAALDSVCQEILTLATAKVEETVDQSPEARVHAVMEGFVDWVNEAPAKASVAVIHASANPRMRARRSELLAVFADFVAREAAEFYGEDAWPMDRARVHGLVYIAGFAELVASWLSGDVQLTGDELVETAEGLFAVMSRRT